MANLTVFQVKSAKCESAPFKMTDGGGLYLYVGKSYKSWRYDYRFLGKRKTLSFGTFPEVSISIARKQHFEARRKLADGIDPAEEKQESKRETFGFTTNCFERLAWEWFERQRGRWTHGHARTVKSRLEQNVIPWIGNRPVGEILPQEILGLCRNIEQRGAIETAHRVKSICSQVFRYCVALGLCAGDPCRDLCNALTPYRSKHMPAITDQRQVGELMRAIDGYQGSNITRIGLQLAPLLFVRPGELRYAEWSEINFSDAIWKIPAAKMKMREAHIVPLSRQALEQLNQLYRFTGDGKYLFPSMRAEDRPMSDNTILSALRRLGFSNQEMTVHGFRGMASTLLHELGWRSEVIERQLAHSDRNSIRAAYNHAEYFLERRELMQFWADYLDVLRLGK